MTSSRKQELAAIRSNRLKRMGWIAKNGPIFVHIETQSAQVPVSACEGNTSACGHRRCMNCATGMAQNCLPFRLDMLWFAKTDQINWCIGTTLGHTYPKQVNAAGSIFSRPGDRFL